MSVVTKLTAKKVLLSPWSSEFTLKNCLERRTFIFAMIFILENKSLYILGAVGYQMKITIEIPSIQINAQPSSMWTINALIKLGMGPRIRIQ